MKAFLSFTAAIADPIRLRLICLALGHKITPSEVATILKLEPSEAARQMKVLTDAGLLKADGKNGFVHVRGRHLKLLQGLFDQLGVAARTDSQLKADAKLAKQLREARHRAEKEARKVKKTQAAEARKAAKAAKISKPAKTKTEPKVKVKAKPSKKKA